MIQSKPVFLLHAPDGQIEGAATTLDEAIEAGEHLHDNVRVDGSVELEDVRGSDGRTQNPPIPEMPGISKKSCGINGPAFRRGVLGAASKSGMTVDEAYQEFKRVYLRRYKWLHQGRAAEGKIPWTGSSGGDQKREHDAAAYYMLGENKKMLATDPEAEKLLGDRDIVNRGLVLLPAGVYREQWCTLYDWDQVEQKIKGKKTGAWVRNDERTRSPRVHVSLLETPAKIPLTPDLIPPVFRDQDEKDDRGLRVNLCVGSSPGCRAVCLVDSGRSNVFSSKEVIDKEDKETAVVLVDGEAVDDDKKATAVQLATNPNVKRICLLDVLFEAPEAFGVMLNRAIELHTQEVVCKGGIFACRLNVFSDVPWEELCPELFGLHPDVMFYDYTKVPGRNTPLKSKGDNGNYWLTFSLAEDNADRVAYELERGKNVAAVFTGVAQVNGKIEVKGQSSIPTPGVGPRKVLINKEKPELGMRDYQPTTTVKFLARNLKIGDSTYDVVNGDASDARFCDPGGPFGRPTKKPVVVGLAYKPPAGAGKAGTENAKKNIIVKARVMTWRAFQNMGKLTRPEVKNLLLGEPAVRAADRKKAPPVDELVDMFFRKVDRKFVPIKPFMIDVDIDSENAIAIHGIDDYTDAWTAVREQKTAEAEAKLDAQRQKLEDAAKARGAKSRKKTATVIMAFSLTGEKALLVPNTPRMVDEDLGANDTPLVMPANVGEPAGLQERAVNPRRSKRWAGDVLPGGRGDAYPPSAFDPRQLQLGIGVEMEHTHNRRIAQDIARDHLAEDPRYFDMLAKAEASSPTRRKLNPKPAPKVKPYFEWTLDGNVIDIDRFISANAEDPDTLTAVLDLRDDAREPYFQKSLRHLGGGHILEVARAVRPGPSAAEFVATLSEAEQATLRALKFSTNYKDIMTAVGTSAGLKDLQKLGAIDFRGVGKDAHVFVYPQTKAWVDAAVAARRANPRLRTAPRR